MAPSLPVRCIILLVLVLCPASSPSQFDHDYSLEEVDCKPDITDMADYDPVTQTSARCEKMKMERRLAKDHCASDLEKVTKELDDCMIGRGYRPLDCPAPPDCKASSSLDDSEDACPDHAKADDMFFFRLTRHLVNVLQDKAPDSGPVEGQLKVHLSRYEWDKLQNFAKGEKDYRKSDIHDVLVGMTMDVFYFNHTRLFQWISEQLTFRSPGTALFVMSVVIASVIFSVGMFSDLYWNRRFLGCLFLAVFVISLFWNWIILYQEETVKRYRNAQQYPNIPANCLPHQMTWVQSLNEWFRTAMTVQTDPCIEYHRMYQVDPLLDIPPSRALAFTISSFFVDPMKYFGRALGEFHGELFRGLPYWLGGLALVSCYIFMFLAVYAFVSAPRRVQRERPFLQRVEGRGEPRHALGAVPRRQQIKDEQPGAREEDYDDHDGQRVENILPINPPTLPPRGDQGVQRRARGGDGNPSGKDIQHSKSDKEGQEQSRKVEASQEDSNRRLQQYSAKRKEGDGRGQGDHPAADDKSIATSSSLTRQEDEDKMDVRGEAKASRIQRPTRLPEGGTGAWKNTSDPSSMLCHPSSELSDMESSVSSVVDPPNLREAYLDDLSEEVTTPTAACASPMSADSPSDDYSIISPSPENTNSATYEFISTSSIGLRSDLVGGGLDSQGQVAEPPVHVYDDDDDDDFVVLKKETQGE